MKVDPESVRAFESSAAFEAWLAKHHDREREIFLRIYKKGSGTPTVTNEEAIDAALCWGWIDAIRKAYDEPSFSAALHAARSQEPLVGHQPRSSRAADTRGPHDAARPTPRRLRESRRSLGRRVRSSEPHRGAPPI